MKKIFQAMILMLSILPASLKANPFSTRFVCVPAVAPDRLSLDFKIRDRGQCVEGERYLEVLPQADGSTLLLPVQDGLSPEERRDLERYRSYLGGEDAAPN